MDATSLRVSRSRSRSVRSPSPIASNVQLRHISPRFQTPEITAYEIESILWQTRHKKTEQPRFIEIDIEKVMKQGYDIDNIVSEHRKQAEQYICGM